MRGALWTILFVILIAWVVSFLGDFWGSSIRALLAIVFIVVWLFIFTRSRTV
jgi:hypothetical protein